MKLPIMSKGSQGFFCRGFSVIEILVVLGIVSALSASAVLLSVHSIARDVCRAQVNDVYRILFHARNRALVSYFQDRQPVGVVFEENRMVAYQGFSPNADFSPEFFDYTNRSFFVHASPGVLFIPDDTGVHAVGTAVQIFGPACNRSITIDKSGAIL